MTKYTIKKRNEETECCYCGYPLYVEDTAYLSKDERRVYCSKVCGQALEREDAPLIKSQPVGVKAGCFDV